ncbi:MAG: hypothetical protein ACK4SY_01310 [Pyrobaculum sp.]
MKLYAASAVLTATYTIAYTLQYATDIYSLARNGIIGAVFSLALMLSLIPLAGPLAYNAVFHILANLLSPPIDTTLLAYVLSIASWALNITFTTALILYMLQIRRAAARRVIKRLLF